MPTGGVHSSLKRSPPSAGGHPAGSPDRSPGALPGHLLQVVEAIRAKGAHFRSLGDPIDTTGPSGVLVLVLVLQMLGAVAEFERNLIRERTKAGIGRKGHPVRISGQSTNELVSNPDRAGVQSVPLPHRYGAG